MELICQIFYFVSKCKYVTASETFFGGMGSKVVTIVMQCGANSNSINLNWRYHITWGKRLPF
jgi:hypothetical protein